MEAVAEAIKTRCCSFSDGDESLGHGWAEREYLRVANEVLQAAYPALRAQVLEEVREGLLALRESEKLWTPGIDAALGVLATLTTEDDRGE